MKSQQHRKHMLSDNGSMAILVLSYATRIHYTCVCMNVVRLIANMVRIFRLSSCSRNESTNSLGCRNFQYIYLSVLVCYLGIRISLLWRRLFYIQARNLSKEFFYLNFKTDFKIPDLCKMLLLKGKAVVFVASCIIST